MKVFSVVTWAAIASASFALGQQPPGLLKGTFDADVAAKVAAANAQAHVLNRRTGTNVSALVPINGWGTFKQLIDHDNPSLGTFDQRYWYSTRYWKGPGSPVVMTCPGEQSGTGWNTTYLTNQRITGYFAEQVGGATVILEHRYWGESSPYPELTVDNLQFLTIENAMRDMTYFAETFVLPFDTTGKSRPSKAPWILAGGSYAGALAAWTAKLYAGTSPFWAYYASSGVVQSIGDFWQYFAMAQKYTPANCSADLTRTMAHIDHVLLHGTDAAKAALKAPFQLGDLADADFTRALALGPYQFQQTQAFFEGYYGYAPYSRFCDYIENAWPGSNSSGPGKKGVGVTKALAGYAKWMTEAVLPHMCESYGFAEFEGTYNTDCLQYRNASSPMYADLSPTNLAGRQWWWLVCNQPLAWFQEGMPFGLPSIVSRLVNRDYFVAICRAQFPELAGGFGLAHGRTVAKVNAYTGGWFVPANKTPRLLHANGEIDPWRAASVSSDWRPGGPMASSANVPIHVVPRGGHCSDVYAENWAVNADVQAVVDAEAATVEGWVNDFYVAKGLSRPT